MKSSFELAMERLNKTGPVAKLTAAQKREIAELESKCKARIAQRELAVRDEIAAAQAAGEMEKAEELQQQFTRERRTWQAELEANKAVIHGQK